MMADAMIATQQSGNSSFLLLPHQCFACGINGVRVVATDHGPVCGECVRIMVNVAVTHLTRGKKWDASDYQIEPAVGFDDFWAAYPPRLSGGMLLKPDKKAAKASFDRAIRTTPAHIIVAAARAYPFDRDNPQYIPGPAVWLNKGAYLAEFDHVSLTAGSASDIDRMHAELSRTINHGE